MTHGIAERYSVGPGEKAVVRLPVTADLDGAEVSLWTHVLRGRGEGPSLTLISTIHGDQWLSIEVMRRIVEQVDVGRMRGTIVVLPVANPVAFGQLSRSMPDRSDAPDLNRVFPGRQNWLSEQIARLISKELLAESDCVLEFHAGGWGAALMMVAYGVDLPNPEIVEASRQLARAFGCRSVHRGRIITVFPGPKSLTSYVSAVLGVPAIMVEIGGVGFAPDLEEQWITATVDGIWNVMRHLNMVEGQPQFADRYLLWDEMILVTPKCGGYLQPTVSPDRLMTEVPKDELLGQVVSPYTFQVLEELKAPKDGVLIMVPRPYPARPGDWSFVLVDTDPEVSEWVDSDW